MTYDDAVTLDFETALIAAGLQTPPIVCAVVEGESTANAIYDTRCYADVVRALLAADGPSLIYGLNIAFDMACFVEWGGRGSWALVRDAYAAGRILDLSCYQRCAEIEGRTAKVPKHSLEMIAQAHGVRADHKGAGKLITKSYGPLYMRPFSDYSDDQITYLRGDGTTGRELFARMRRKFGDSLIAPATVLSRNHFWLTATKNYGFRTDPEKIDDLRHACEIRLEELASVAREPYLLPSRLAVEGEPYYCGATRKMQKAKADTTLPAHVLYTRDMFKTESQWRKAVDTLRFERLDGTGNKAQLKALVRLAYDGEHPQTPAGAVSTANHVLVDSADPMCEALADFGQWKAVKNKDLKMLVSASRRPAHTTFRFADTTRTTSSNPNTQNFRKNKFRLADGRLIGIRECVVPREGNCLIGADWSTLEMRTLAQLTYKYTGSRDLLDQINEGVDVHCRTAEYFYANEGLTWKQIKQLGKDGDKQAKLRRNMCKVPNFGCPGELNKPETLRIYARTSYDMRLTLEECRELIAAVKHKQPDIGRYLKHVRKHFRHEVPIPGIALTRRGMTRSASANTGFQGLAARIAGEVGWEILCATMDPRSALFGCRLILFVHDEFILECPIGRQTEAVAELIGIMTGPRARTLLPDVELVAEGFASAYWSKDAEAEYDAAGKLRIWNADIE